jgi:hypothetical protein
VFTACGASAILERTCTGRSADTGKISVYPFKVWEAVNDQMVRSRRLATPNAIRNTAHGSYEFSYRIPMTSCRNTQPPTFLESSMRINHPDTILARTRMLKCGTVPLTVPKNEQRSSTCGSVKSMRLRRLAYCFESRQLISIAWSWP